MSPKTATKTTKTKKMTKPVKVDVKETSKAPRANVETLDMVLAMVAKEGGLTDNQVKKLLDGYLPKGSRFKKGYRFKDENAPKRPISSYMLWVADNREKIQKENPDMKIGELNGKFGEIWRELDSKARYPYEKVYNKAKKEYAKELAAYYKENPDMIPKSQKPKSDKPVSGWIRFTKEQRSDVAKKNPDLKPTDITKKLGKMWNALDEDERDVYNDQAKDELEVWYEVNPDKKPKSKTTKTKKEDEKKVDCNDTEVDDSDDSDSDDSE